MSETDWETVKARLVDPDARCHAEDHLRGTPKHTGVEHLSDDDIDAAREGLAALSRLKQQHAEDQDKLDAEEEAWINLHVAWQQLNHQNVELVEALRRLYETWNDPDTPGAVDWTELENAMEQARTALANVEEVPIARP
jgi:uncharacterized UBP type Zn finger protein